MEKCILNPVSAYQQAELLQTMAKQRLSNASAIHCHLRMLQEMHRSAERTARLYSPAELSEDLCS